MMALLALVLLPPAHHAQARGDQGAAVWLLGTCAGTVTVNLLFWAADLYL